MSRLHGKEARMSEYIEREALERCILGLTIVDPAVAQYANAVLLCLKDAPAADVSPVVHGRWIIGERGLTVICKCSVCGYPANYFWSRTPYCQNCGAKMDLEG